MASVPPPGGNGTTSRTKRFGQVLRLRAADDGGATDGGGGCRDQMAAADHRSLPRLS